MRIDEKGRARFILSCGVTAEMDFAHTLEREGGEIDLGIEPVAVTGPATDNLVGTRLIEERLGLPAFNARTAAPALAAVVTARLGIGSGAAAGALGAGSEA